MRFLFADPGLLWHWSHHANTCRLISGALRARGIEPEILAFQEVDAELQSELGAKPHFKFFTYAGNPDPICGWLNAFDKNLDLMMEGMSRIGPTSAEDVVFVNSAQAAVFLGTGLWLSGLSPKERPQVVLEFGTDPGVEAVPAGKGHTLIARDPRIDARGVLNRFAASNLPRNILSHFHPATFDADSSSTFSALMGIPVAVLPLPHVAVVPPRLRGTKSPTTVAVVGHQRWDKGYQHLPQIVQHVLKSHPQTRFLLHNAKPQDMPEVHAELSRLAATEPRIVMVSGPAIWSELLEAADIILCPYDPTQFIASYSSVTAHAIASGIPMVVPAGTTLSRTLNDFGAGGTAFDRFTPDAIALAVGKTLDGIAEYAQRALTGAEQWARINGPTQTVDAIFKMARPTAGL